MLIIDHFTDLCEIIFLAPSGAQEMQMFVCPVKSVLEFTIFIFLSQVSLRSLSGLSVLTSSDRRSLKYFVLFIYLVFCAIEKKVNVERE